MNNPHFVVVLLLATQLSGCQTVLPISHLPPARELPPVPAWPVRQDFPPMEATRAQALSADFQWILEKTGAPGMTAAVAAPGLGLWKQNQGEFPLFYWASVGKTFTTAVILQLGQEGRLSLGDRLSRWYPDFPDAEEITVDELLRHTSGVYSFQEDEGFQASGQFLDPEAAIGIARRHGNLFAPGTNWYYSNTGYIFLGRIIETVDGRSYREAVEQRIVRRLGLKSLRVLAPGEVPAGLAPVVDPATGRVFQPSQPFAAGAVVAPADEMILFWQAFLSGALFDAELVHSGFVPVYPLFGDKIESYGRGVMAYLVPVNGSEAKPDFWLGHSGGTPGAKALLVWDVETGIFAAVAFNSDSSAEASVLKLLKTARLLVSTPRAAL